MKFWIPSQLILGLLLFSLGACTVSTESTEESKGENPTQGSIPGLKMENKGLQAKRVQLKNRHEQLISSSQLIYGERVRLYFDEVEGFERMQGDICRFQMSATFRDSKGEIAMQFENMHEQGLQGIAWEDARFPFANLVLANPLKSEQDYELELKIWDLTNGKSMSAFMPIKLRKDPNLNFETKDLFVQEAYIWDALGQNVQTSGIIRGGKAYYLIFEGLQGLTEQKGRVKIKANVRLTDANGRLIAENPDVFPDESYAVQDVRDRLSSTFYFPETGVANPALIETLIYDGYSENWLKIRYQIRVD